ncbi:hypothetical protein SO802_002556 [Lithocarpus litseifolius]|uniref:Uncharacterized protein n=1 Tax=Lithocarpus litseifolius TaxID=425828 RepID=A0AAW2DXJ6_9ROSI
MEGSEESKTREKKKEKWRRKQRDSAVALTERKFHQKEIDSAIDVNLTHPVEIDDEIAEVDVTDDETDKGSNAAEALRSLVNAEARKEQTSSASSSSESESSESGSGSESESSSGSRDSESSAGDSLNSI